MEFESEAQPVPRQKWRIIVIGCVLVFSFFGYGTGVIVPPSPLHSGEVAIEKGMNADRIGRVLKDAHIIRSRYFFVWAVYLGGIEQKLGAGRYTFEKPQSIFRVIAGLVERRREITLAIPEGLTIKEIAALVAKNGFLPENIFIAATKKDYSGQYLVLAGHPLEGFLFPDTYRFFETATADDVISTLLAEQSEKIAPLEEDILRSGKSVYAIITMASILEEEGRTEKDKKIIAGILWRRLKDGTPLQVDATLGYITGRGSRDLTVSDLKSTDPFNTYVHKGLPPTPISNPGLESIQAALFPESSPYYYYLSDSSGVMHYARTFEEHKKNKAKYL